MTDVGCLRMKRASIAALAALGFVLSGCATTLHGGSQVVGFRSIPSGATVSVSGQSAITPAELKLSRKQEHTVFFTSQGFLMRQFDLRRTLSGAFYGNIVLGGLIGMAVDMGSGGAYNLSLGNVEMDMLSGVVREFDKDEPVRVAAPPPASTTPMPIPPPPPLVMPADGRSLGTRLKEVDVLWAAGRINEGEAIALRRRVIETQQ